MADEILATQLRAINDRMNNIHTDVAQVFEKINDVRLVLERNTLTVEEHHRRSKLLEKLQISIQKRVDAAEKLMKELGDTVSQLSKRLDPVEKNVSRVSWIIQIFMGMPVVVKWVSSIFTMIILGYGVFAIIRDILGKWGF